jgi:catechol 2,3-dioxygenase-like lactoylglutathione lyase family enzyme
MFKCSSLTVFVPVTDINRAIDFYENKLGFLPKGKTPEDNYLFSIYGETYIALSPKKEINKEATVLSFEVEDIAFTVYELKESEINFIEKINKKHKNHIYLLDTEKAAWFNDSEGNILSIHQLTECSIGV